MSDNSDDPANSSGVKISLQNSDESYVGDTSNIGSDSDEIGIPAVIDIPDAGLGLKVGLTT